MPKPPLDANQRRSQQVLTMLTPREKAAVARLARELGMSISTAVRYLIMRGLATHESTFTAEGEQHDD